MADRRSARDSGLLFIVSVLGMIALLVIGLGIASWFTAKQQTLATEGDGAFTHATTSVSLSKIEVCENSQCVSTWTYDLADEAFGKLALVTLATGIAFGALVLWLANRRIADAEVSRLIKWLAYLLAAAVIAEAQLCMFVFPPEPMAYQIVSTVGSLYSPYTRVPDYTFAMATEPSLGLGGFLACTGVLLGVFVVWGARSPERAARPERRLRKPRRTEPPVAGGGPETDPFRAPPGPKPIAVIRHERPATTPVADNPSGEPPKLLR
jgi:hypothetical protein